MSNKETMTVIYFTDGALIEDLHIRKSLLRIPEVIKALRDYQGEFLNCDLFIIMMDQALFLSLNYHQKLRLKNLLQTALFERWTRLGGQPDLIIRRRDYLNFSDITSLFLKLSSLEKLKVVTIGPGFDELESYLKRQHKLEVKPHFDVISQDPSLDWFWNDVKSSIQLHS